MRIMILSFFIKLWDLILNYLIKPFLWNPLRQFRDTISCSESNSITSLIALIIISLLVIFLGEGWLAKKHWQQCHQKSQIQEQQSDNRSSIFIINCQNEEKFNLDNKLSYLLQKIVDSTTQTSIILMVITFFYLSRITYCLHNNKEQKNKKNINISEFLTEVLIGSLSISAIPTGISLTICAIYDIRFIEYMSGVEIYIAFASISLISIGFLSTLQEHDQIEDRITKSIEDMLKKSDQFEPETFFSEFIEKDEP